MPQEISCIPSTTETTKIKDTLFQIGTTTYTTQFYESYIPNNKSNKHNPNNQNNDINVGFTTKTKFVLLQLRQRKFWSIHIQISTNFKKIIFHQFRTFHPSTICTFYQSRKTCTPLDEQFRTFHPSLYESVTETSTFVCLKIFKERDTFTELYSSTVRIVCIFLILHVYAIKRFK